MVLEISFSVVEIIFQYLTTYKTSVLKVKSKDINNKMLARHIRHQYLNSKNVRN